MKRSNSKLKEAKTIAIGGHVRPDGDCVCSVMALYHYLKKELPEAEVDDSVKNGPFSGKVVVKGALPDADGPRDVPHGDAVVAPLGEEVQGGLHDFFLRRHSAPPEKMLFPVVY